MWWILLLIVLSFFVLILFSRLVLLIDSRHEVYEIIYGRLLVARLLMHDDIPAVEVKVLWWQKVFPLTGIAQPTVKEDKEKPVQRQKPRRRIPLAKVAQKAKGLLASFRVTHCFISIDTGNMPLNGLLFPWFYLLERRSGKKIMINFEGHTIVVLRIENTIARLLWAYIKS